jgi:hypothetical protein
VSIRSGSDRPEPFVHSELLICAGFRDFPVSCYDAAMRDPLILFIHLLTTVARPASPGGVRSVVAESVLVKHQLLILNRSRHRAPPLRLSDRMSNTITPTVFYRTLNVEGLEIFYREAGPQDAPTVLLLHGFPSSSHMFRNLIPMLADKYHVVAPDFPGYGESSAPSVNDFDYSYERLATVTEQFTEKLNLSSYATCRLWLPSGNSAARAAEARRRRDRGRQCTGRLRVSLEDSLFQWIRIENPRRPKQPRRSPESL